ncbi:hypothetical protein ECD227_4076 (plasmid) [Escherichia fergusonii ECD227]|nr:hypothetical protein ECD227_4076 [Escherichia fergusonii ECD227]
MLVELHTIRTIVLHILASHFRDLRRANQYVDIFIACKSELEFRRYQSFAFGRVGSIAALNKFTVSLSVIVPHIKSFYWNARTISELLYIEEPVNWRLTVFFRKCPLLSLGASRSKLMSWIATSMMLIRRPMFSVTRSGIRPPILASLSSGLIIADNAAIAPETSVNGSNKAMKVTGSVKVGGVPPSQTIKLFQRATDVVSVPTCAKPLKAPATEPMDIPVKGASQFWAMFIAAPWLIYPVTWY